MATEPLRSAVLACIVSFSLAPGWGQTNSAQNISAQAPEYPVSTITTGTRLVVVDVIVQDKHGKPVHGLSQHDFAISESNSPQAIRTFDEHSSALPTSQTTRPPLPHLEPGTYTNYAAVPATGGPLNVLLLDSLNTITPNQRYVLAQVRRYLDQAPPGSRTAVFALSRHLMMVQGFTTDTTVLRAAIDAKGNVRPSQFLPFSDGNNLNPQSPADRINDLDRSIGDVHSKLVEAVAGLRQYASGQESSLAQFRVAWTLEAFNSLAHYLAPLPGRKNILWFSESFPAAIAPDPTVIHPLDVATNNSLLVQSTTALLARARAAVYPIDANEFIPGETFTRPFSGRSPSVDTDRDSSQEGRNLNQSIADLAARHGTMQQMAEDTGGRAFLDGGHLFEAVQQAVESGTNYYTLTYSPPLFKGPSDVYRSIKVSLADPEKQRGMHLLYRHGYFPDKPEKFSGQPSGSLPPGMENVAELAYLRSSMQRGGPLPEDVVFEARILPASTVSEAQVAAHNTPNPKASEMKPPFRTLDVDIVTMPRNLTLTLGPDKLRHGKVEYVTYVYDANGLVLNAETATLELGFSEEDFKKLAVTGLGYRQKVSVPEKTLSFVRVAVHDVPSGRLGAIEVPVSETLRLRPLSESAKASGSP